jgi:integrase
MPKSRKGRRWVPAPPAQRALARHRKAQQAQREFLGIDYDDHDLVICRPDGLPLRPDRVTVAFEGHVAGCGLPVIRLLDTRHGACSLMLAGGVPIEIVQMILGHSSPGDHATGLCPPEAQDRGRAGGESVEGSDAVST